MSDNDKTDVTEVSGFPCFACGGPTLGGFSARLWGEFSCVVPICPECYDDSDDFLKRLFARIGFARGDWVNIAPDGDEVLMVPVSYGKLLRGGAEVQGDDLTADAVEFYLSEFAGDVREL